MDHKYEEALERAKELHEAGNALTKSQMEVVFPELKELKESEDESIRKVLIHIVKGACDKYGIKYKGDNITEEKLLAYLEKQKDEAQKQFNLGIQAGREEVLYEMEKEQQLAEWSEEDEDYLMDVKSAVNHYFEEGYAKELCDWVKNLSERFNSRPMQEWSEEDEKMIRFYEADYNNQIDDMSMKEVIDMRLEFKNWLINRLKFLRPVNQKWSDDDEIWAHLILRELEKVKKDSPEYSKHFERLIEWFTYRFKSLRPQPHWKPSDEQMEALDRCVEYLDESDNEDVDVMNSLYDDLQKLL